MNEKKTEVQRAKTLTAEQLIEHIKAVGKAIIDDAESVAIDTSKLRSITIEAEIAPMEQVTTITYRRTADPRMG